jgi:hypothetical protein
MKQLTIIAIVLLAAIIGWQEFRRNGQLDQIRLLRNEAVRLQQPDQVNDSTQVVGALEGVLLERDRSIKQLKKDLGAATRAQMDISWKYEADLAEMREKLEVLVDSATSTPVNDSLSLFVVPFTVAIGDSNHSTQVDGSVDLVQPGPEYLSTIGVKLIRLTLQAEVQIDLVEGKDGWQTIVRSSTSSLHPDVKLAVTPRSIPWFERIKVSAGLGIREGSPLVFTGVRMDPWGFGVTAGGGVGVFIYKTF